MNYYNNTDIGVQSGVAPGLTAVMRQILPNGCFGLNSGGGRGVPSFVRAVTCNTRPKPAAMAWCNHGKFSDFLS